MFDSGDIKTLVKIRCLQHLISNSPSFPHFLPLFHQLTRSPIVSSTLLSRLSALAHPSTDPLFHSPFSPALTFAPPNSQLFPPTGGRQLTLLPANCPPTQSSLHRPSLPCTPPLCYLSPFNPDYLLSDRQSSFPPSIQEYTCASLLLSRFNVFSPIITLRDRE